MHSSQGGQLLISLVQFNSQERVAISCKTLSSGQGGWTPLALRCGRTLQLWLDRLKWLKSYSQSGPTEQAETMRVSLTNHRPCSKLPPHCLWWHYSLSMPASTWKYWRSRFYDRRYDTNVTLCTQRATHLKPSMTFWQFLGWTKCDHCSLKPLS